MHYLTPKSHTQKSILQKNKNPKATTTKLMIRMMMVMHHSPFLLEQFPTTTSKQTNKQMTDLFSSLPQQEQTLEPFVCPPSANQVE